MTLKEFLEKAKNGKNITIHVKTQAEYDKLMKELDKAKVRWMSEERPSDHNYFPDYEEQTCLVIDSDMLMTYSMLLFLEDDDMTPVLFSDLTFND